jgi:hypothetical protein
LGKEKTAMATAVTSATWRNSACCLRRRNNDHFAHGYVNIMSFNVCNFGCMSFGVRAQNLLEWMAIENRCGLGARRVDKYSQSHVWTDDVRTLGRVDGNATHSSYANSSHALAPQRTVRAVRGTQAGTSPKRS